MEVKKFGKAYNIHVVCAYGGGNMHEQQRACEEGPEVIVATPVSSIQLILFNIFFPQFDKNDNKIIQNNL